LDLRAITRCEAARSGDDRQARHHLLQHPALARRAIFGISSPLIPWPMAAMAMEQEKFKLMLELFRMISQENDIL